MTAQAILSIGPEAHIDLLGFDPFSDSLLCFSHTQDTPANTAQGALAPLDVFWNNLEVACVAACCGVQAFGWWPDDICRAAQGLNQQSLVEALRQTKQTVLSANKDVVSYDRFNQLFARASFLRLLDHLLSVLATDSREQVTFSNDS
ncbi:MULTISPECIES: DUF6331 family protein [Hymenobacter]|uniref:Uncharacterized protein n=2 Tax=Hymenobacter TaxID=89966 RepID=A0A7Y7PKU1_9BACT|nr:MULTISPECIES: DUF6331 family protein [Hymenobacter]NVO29600.1 hypothetical protein [Hymenobacter lapidiphilus]OWP61911.1 hypothetical protein CDA63_16840 [Hymenobacter amundsenii]